MMTRRNLLRFAGAAGLATLGASAACERRTTDPAGSRPANDLLFVEFRDGLAVLDAVTGRPRIAASPSVVSPDWARLVGTAPEGTGTRIVSHRVDTGQVASGSMLRGRLEPRVVSPGGRLIALATPGGVGVVPYRPAGRIRTTIVVADDSGERVRLDLPGNLEPEAFATTGQGLYVLDYLPPAAPDRYRVRMVDLATRRLMPLQTRLKVPVPAGAEEEMRGEGRQAVYDAPRHLLFTLYTHQPDHLHTRDLVGGARPGAPQVHAFVHTLNLAEQWAYCIDLPAPFGEHSAAAHAITLSGDGSRLVVVDAATGSVADIDPESLTVLSVVRFAPPAAPVGDAAAALTDDGARLVVGAGRDVVTLSPVGGADRPTRWSCQAPVRGLALHSDGRQVYVGGEHEIVRHDLASGRVMGRTAAPGLLAVRHLAPAS